MIHTRKAMSILLLLHLPLLQMAPACFANPVFPAPGWEEIAPMLGIALLIACFLTVIVESLFLILVLWLPLGLWPRVLVAVGIVNLITIPLTQLVWWAINAPLLVPMGGVQAVVPIVLLELIVALAEFFLLRWQFEKLWHHGFFSTRVRNGHLILATAIANGASFVIGFGLLDLSIYWRTQALAVWSPW